VKFALSYATITSLLQFSWRLIPANESQGQYLKVRDFELFGPNRTQLLADILGLQ
jgi:hypothetical protein